MQVWTHAPVKNEMKRENKSEREIEDKKQQEEKKSAEKRGAHTHTHALFVHDQSGAL